VFPWKKLKLTGEKVKNLKIYNKYNSLIMNVIAPVFSRGFFMIFVFGTAFEFNTTTSINLKTGVMKAIITTTMMLMAISFGTLEASAQSAKRSTPDSRQKKTSQYSTSRTAQPSQARKSPKATQQKNTPKYSKTITTTRNNPRSDYKASTRTHQYGKTSRDPRQENYYAQRTQPKKHVSTSSHHIQSAGYSSGHRHYYPRRSVKVHYHPVTYREHYRAMYYPAHREIIWTNRMHRYYVGLYPEIRLRYPIGYRVQTISALDARYNVGEIARVYGRVYGTWYNRESDDLLLFFGGEWPNQEFTMIIPGSVARRYSWRPERYFLGQHVMATGYISNFEGRPEMLVKKRNQVEVF
jgi:hypothetical protein